MRIGLSVGCFHLLGNTFPGGFDSLYRFMGWKAWATLLLKTAPGMHSGAIRIVEIY